MLNLFSTLIAVVKVNEHMRLRRGLKLGGLVILNTLVAAFAAGILELILDKLFHPVRRRRLSAGSGFRMLRLPASADSKWGNLAQHCRKVSVGSACSLLRPGGVGRPSEQPLLASVLRHGVQQLATALPT